MVRRLVTSGANSVLARYLRRGPAVAHVSVAGALANSSGEFVLWQATLQEGTHSLRKKPGSAVWWDEVCEVGVETSVQRFKENRTFVLFDGRLSVHDNAHSGDLAGGAPYVRISETLRDGPRILVSETFGSPRLGHAHVVVLRATETELPWRLDDSLPIIGSRQPVVTLQPEGDEFWIGLFDLCSD